SLQLEGIGAQPISNEQQQSLLEQQHIGFPSPAYAFAYNPGPYAQAEQLQPYSIASATSEQFREQTNELTRVTCYQQQANVHVPNGREYLMVTGRPQP
ncbi:unnamed protein product, partial [Brugia timori]